MLQAIRAVYRPTAALTLLLTVAPATAADLVLDGADGPHVTAVINGVPLRLKVAFDHTDGITLNPDAALRAGLGQGDGRWIEQIGPVELEGRSAQARLVLAGVATRTSIRWRGSPVLSGADGAVSAHTLPFDSVTVRRAAAAPGERELLFATRLHDNHGIHYRLKVGDRRVAVRFSLDRPRTTAPAAAAAVIAEQQGGQLGQERLLEEIVPGVERPVRPLRLDRPLAVAGLSVPVLMVRTSDFRGAHRSLLVEQPAAAGEIVVTGARPSQDALYRITLGLDVLGRCSAATYRRRTGELRLRCAPA